MANDISSVRALVISPQTLGATETEKSPVSPVEPIRRVAQRQFADSGNQLPQESHLRNTGQEKALERAVESANQRFQMHQRSLQFKVDDSSNHLVIKVIDKETDEVVRQIPSEEFLELSKRMEEMQDLFFMVDEQV